MYYRVFVYSTDNGEIQGLISPMNEALINRAIDILFEDLYIAENCKLMSVLTISVGDEFSELQNVHPVKFSFCEERVIDAIRVYRRKPDCSYSGIGKYENEIRIFDEEDFVIRSCSGVQFDKY